jgi:hypothetical protein
MALSDGAVWLCAGDRADTVSTWSSGSVPGMLDAGVRRWYIIT